MHSAGPPNGGRLALTRLAFPVTKYIAECQRVLEKSGLEYKVRWEGQGSERAWPQALIDREPTSCTGMGQDCRGSLGR